MFKCKYCGKECKNKNSLAQHEIRCKENPNRIKINNSGFLKYNEFRKLNNIKGENQFTKAKRLGLDTPIVSEITRKKLSDAGKRQIWTEERKIRLSESMRKAVKNNPESYNSSNINGRTPKINYNGVILDGSWEVLVANFLDKNQIYWEKPKNGFIYFWQGKNHLYYPDFYLPELDLYIEVKGYERERDTYKWKAVPNLLILKKTEIEQIKNNTYKFMY